MSVMNVKRATQTYSKADSGTGFRPPNEEVHTSSATDTQKAYGEQNVGDVLNKIADPNWVDPSKKIRATGDPTLGKDAFMKLMLTQMKYQDPSNPLQSHEMAAQLAQFSSLEQLSNIHGTLESMKTQASPQTNYQALALIGKHVSGDSSKLSRVAGDTKHGISFELLGDAANVKVTIKDAGGNVIRKIEAGAMKKGRNSFEWNGLKDDGMAARPGEYRVSVEGQNKTGGKIYAKTAFGGRITGLNFTPEGPVLMVGNQSIKLSDVKKIEDAGGDEAPAGTPAEALTVGQKAAPAKSAIEKTAAEVKSQTTAAGDKYIALDKAAQPNIAKPTEASKADENVPPAEEPDQPGNINSIPMSRELMARLDKELK